jgi:hypothetical protein
MESDKQPKRAARRSRTDEGRRLKTVPAGSDLAVDIYDCSRRMTGDRWRVSVVFRVGVPVADALAGSDEPLPATADVIRDVLGEQVIFEQNRGRVFVDESSKDILVETLVESFLQKILPYLSHPAFPRRCVLKC